MEDLKNPDVMYRSLGAKMVVGMPFKDIATTDSIYLPQGIHNTPSHPTPHTVSYL